jgi:S1-C subfamily serine protease
MVRPDHPGSWRYGRMRPHISHHHRGIAMSEDTTIAAFSASLAALVKSAGPSVVAITGHRIRASGFLWKPGYIITAEETLHGDGPFEVMMGGKTRKADLRGRDPSTDIALLKLDAEAGVPVKFGLTPEAGSIAIAVGAVEADKVSSMGTVSRVGASWHSMRGGEIDQRIELDLRLRGGMQGALVLGADSAAFGMAVMGPKRRSLVIPSTTIERVAAKLLDHGHIARGYLGLSLKNVRVEGGEGRGSMIVGLDPQGPGAKAGLHQGDVLVSWDGVPAEEAEPLAKALGPASVGKEVDFGVKRAGQMQTVRVVIGERPAA